MKRAIMLLAALTIMSGLALPAAAALASSRPLPKIQTDGFGNWHTAWRVRPAAVGFGMHFLIKNVRYSSYGQRSAYGHGRLEVDSCRPNCVKGGHWVKATAHFFHVFDHAGPGRNFGNLRLRWHHHTMLLWITSRGQWQWAG
jgi:hypothetical protein